MASTYKYAISAFTEGFENEGSFSKFLIVDVLACALLIYTASLPYLHDFGWFANRKSLTL